LIVICQEIIYRTKILHIDKSDQKSLFVAFAVSLIDGFVCQYDRSQFFNCNNESKHAQTIGKFIKHVSQHCNAKSIN
jgi:hypothetical protein